MKTFTAVLERAGVSAWVRDLHSDEVVLTPGAWRQLGYPDDGSPRKSEEWRSLIHPDDLPSYDAGVADHLKGRSPQLHLVFRIRAADGAWRTLEARGRVVDRDPSGGPLLVGGMLTDITSESPLTPLLFRTVVEAANEGIWMIDLAGRTWFANQRMADMLGMSLECLMKTPPSDVWFPEDVARASGVIERTIRGSSEHFEITFRRLDGGRIPVLGGSAPIRADTGAITGAVAMFSDLTERKAAEDALVASERQARIDHVRLAAAQEGANAGAWEVDLDRDAVVLDARSLAMHGLPSTTLMPISVDDWLDTIRTGREELLDAVQCCAPGAQFQCEYTTGKGTTWVLALGGATQFGADGSRKVVGLNLNVSEAKCSEQEVGRMRGELAHLSRITAMGSMASAIAHELNQPLAAMTNYLSVAEMMIGKGDVGQVASTITAAKDTALRAGGIVRKIREGVISRHSVRRPLDLRDVVNSALQLALLDASQRGIQVSKHLRRGVGVLVDPIQIEQVVVNLVRNAIDAVAGRTNPSVSISATVSKKRATVTVTDNGRGVSKAARARLFETFSTTKSEGMGLGLSICRTIVEAHGGRIWLDETSGRGTSFKFDLPLESSNSDARLSNGSPEPASR